MHKRLHYMKNEAKKWVKFLGNSMFMGWEKSFHDLHHIYYIWYKYKVLKGGALE